MIRAWLYLLHFDIPHHHAGHYLGVTRNLKKRLESHRHGTGAKLTAAIHKLGGTWQLGTLYEVIVDDIDSLFSLEAHCKRWHNGPKFCTICTHGDIPKPPCCKDYPIESLPFNPHKEEKQ